ncbi:hypothetical protein R3P38DRAFT_3241328 [Favolaschia claudopus]|uniref:Uncharacterized protein n=1 Tax=Favolaschia claudopus TaxID=2862362 RepID=A0AAV9Z606_9AGAR
MTSFNPPAPGTELPVPGGANTSSNDATAAALHTMLSAMAILTQPHPPDAAVPVASRVSLGPTVVVPTAATVPAAPASPPAASASPPPAPASPPPAPAAPPAVAAPAHPLPGLRTSGPWIAGSMFLVVPTQHLQAIVEPTYATPEEAPRWYSITKGKYVGVTTNNALAVAAVSGVSGFNMKKHRTQLLALAEFNLMHDYHMVTILV